MDFEDSLRRWLDRHGVEDKDSRGDIPTPSKIEEAERLRRISPQASLDLHGMRGAEAVPAIARFLAESARQGLEKVLIIHGKGIHSAENHVMTDLVRRTLESEILAGSFGKAEKRWGGSGATWVVVRKRDYFSR
jgi:DNA-nicking Smr family endonuclease